jgi:hypothetical protein
LDPVQVFGAAAIAAMVGCYALEARGPGWVLGFAAACAASAAYALLVAAWPFAVAETLWTVVALRRWRRRAA